MNLNLKETDAIISVETLEHLNKKDGLKWLQTCHKNLNKNGILFVHLNYLE